MTRTALEARQLEIENKVRKTLRSEPRLGPHFHLAELKLEGDGVLVLGGEVSEVAAKKMALEKAAAIPGITGIVDRLRVKPAAQMGDKEIRAHLRDAFVAETNFQSLEIREFEAGKTLLVRGAPGGKLGSIDIEVDAGIVTLNGSVTGLTSKRLAGVLAWWMPGVRDVVNGIEVDPPEEDSPDLIAESVRAVLEKDPLINPSQIRIGVRKTCVRLTGLVATEAERQAAERDAWFTFGVDNVLNEIKAQP